MRSRISWWALMCLLLLVLPTEAAPEAASAQVNDEKAQQTIDTLEKPLYSAFTERYILDEIKQLRIDVERNRAQFTKELAEREMSLSDRAVTYATDTVTYFFYLIAAGSSILVLIGWNSLRDIKEKTHSMANEQVSKLVTEYEKRLKVLEKELRKKTADINENRIEIEKTQELHSLWLKAAQDHIPSNKINIYDQILALNPQDCEALTYKADAVLELAEPQWASNLCHQALAIDPDNSHAFYQLACAQTAMGYHEEAIQSLRETLKRSEHYREEIENDPALRALREANALDELLSPQSIKDQL